MTGIASQQMLEGIGALTATSETRRTLERHRRVWARKGVLREVYHAYYGAILEHVTIHRPIVELGSGPGFFKEFAPEIVSTDVEPFPWIDQVVDGCHLPFDDGSVGNLVMMDVLHHLPRPFDFFADALRVLQPGGRVVMMEPWTSPLGLFVYGYLCHEGIDRKVDPSDAFGDDKAALDGNAALPRMIFDRMGVKYESRNTPPNASLEAQPLYCDEISQSKLVVKCVKPRPAFTYLLTGGFQPICLLPRPLLPVMRWVDRVTTPLSKWLALRALIVLEKTKAQSAPLSASMDTCLVAGRAPAFA